MLSKRMVLIIGVLVLIFVNIIILSLVGRTRFPDWAVTRVAITITSPFQELTAYSIRFIRDIWEHYFFLVSVSYENDMLRKALNEATKKNNQCIETSYSNKRLRKLLNFQKSTEEEFIAAEVIGRDPSPHFKSIIIDKGLEDGLKKNLPVVVPEGIAGQITDLTDHYSKVLLIVDPNSSVDALVQRTRARGVIKGLSAGKFVYKYALRKHDIAIGDIIVSSGLDGVFPKGLRIGHVSEVVKGNSGIFQDVVVTPFVDFEKLEEVLVVINEIKEDDGNDIPEVPTEE